MFDNIGRDLDEEANKRRATSFLLTSLLLGSAGLVFGISVYTAANAVMESDLDDQLVDLVEDAMDDGLAPPPPPPPP
ncbi:MAG: hypothetical protein ABMA64_34515, partial [Myxococcota bacterium]